MTRILLEADGLLRRFGRPVPDAVGLVAALGRLREGLARRVRTGSTSRRDEERERELALDVAAVRFGAGPAAVSLGEVYAGLPLRVLADVADLGPGDLYFTTSHVRFAAAHRQRAAAYKVGLGQADGGRGVDFSDVPRVVEEALRLPTARPMSPASRRGGLLAIAVASQAQARMVTLEAIRSDLHADWVALANHLLLYTENPDLEDRLAERPGVDRLSYGVRRDDLVFEWEGGTSSSERGGTLFRAGDVVLREIPSEAPRSPRSPPGEPAGQERPTADGRARRWWDVKRRFLGRGAGEQAANAARLELTREAAAAHRSTLAEMEDALRRLLRAPVGETMLPALSELVGPEAAADAWPADTSTTPPAPPRFLAWQTPYASPDGDALPVVLHHLGDAPGVQPGRTAEEAAGHQVLLRAMAAALASADFLRRQPTAPGALHVLDLGPTTSAASGDAPAPAALFLLTEERSRVRPRVAFRYDDLSDAGSSARLQSLLSLIAASGGDPDARS